MATTSTPSQAAVDVDPSLEWVRRRGRADPTLGVPRLAGRHRRGDQTEVEWLRSIESLREAGLLGSTAGGITR
jgi:hypothetical protein